MTGTFSQPDFQTDTGTNYKSNIDNSVEVVAEVGNQFAVHEQSTPDMTVRIDTGRLFTGAAVTTVAAQNSGTITAPSTNPRIDRVVLNPIAGTISVITGAEAASPTAPDVTSGNVPLAQISLTTSHTTIQNTDITDERVFVHPIIYSITDMGIVRGAIGATDASNNLAGGSQRAFMDISGGDARFGQATGTGASGDLLLFANNTQQMQITAAGDVSATTVSGDWTASQAQMETATATDQIVTPGRQHYHPGHPKAWGQIVEASGTPTLTTDYNIDSISDDGVGDYGVTITTDFSSANYCIALGINRTAGPASADWINKAVGTFSVRAFVPSTDVADDNSIDFICMGDQ